MRKFQLLLGILLLGASGLFGQSASKTLTINVQPAANSGLGWTSFSNTNLSAICPGYSEIQGNSGCSAVMSAWSGGTYDNQRARFIISGGGHNDYFGNEVYAFDFSNGAPTRVLVHDATHNPNFSVTDNEAFPDGNPTPRHTYGCLNYSPTFDVYVYCGGGSNVNGNIENGIWLYNPNNNTWHNVTPSGGPNWATNGTTPKMAYDSVTDAFYALADASPGKFWKLTLTSQTTATWFDLTNASPISGAPCTGSPVGGGGTGKDSNAVIAPDYRFYVCAGNGELQAVNLNTNAVQNDSGASGCATLANGPGPGMAYDPGQGLVVGYVGGNSVIEYNPDSVTHSGVSARTCSTVTFSGGPGAQQANGTYGRFQYNPNHGTFVVVNAMSANVFELRLVPLLTLAQQDFTRRSTGAGVTKARSWDSAGDFPHAIGCGGQASGLIGENQDAGPIRGFQDSAIAYAGTSLRFDVPANDTSSQPVGYYMQQLEGDCVASPVHYGENSVLYYQFQYRVAPEFLSFNWQSAGNQGTTGPKSHIVFGPLGASCTSDQWVQEDTGETHTLRSYVQCSSPGLTSGDAFWEQADPVSGIGYNCARVPNRDYTADPTCFTYPTNKWITEYWAVHIGTWGSSNHHFEAWVAVNGGPYRKFIDQPNFGPFGDGADHTVKMSGMQLLFYVSGGVATGNPATHVWYDGLVISTNPIPAPATPPALP